MKQYTIILMLGLAMAIAGAGCSKSDGEKELDKGLRELKRDNFVRAKALFEKSIARRPGHIDNAVAHNYLGIAAWRLGQFQEAMNAFEDSRRLNPNLIEPVYNLGVLAAERDDMRNATRHLNDAANLSRSDPRPLEYLAELHMQRGQWTLARNALYSALDRETRSPRIYNSIASVHLGLNQVEPAIESLMQALEVNTKYAPALFNLAVIYDKQKGDADQARAYYKRFLSAAPRDARVGDVRAALTRLDQKGALGVAATPPVTPEEPVLVSPTEVVDVAPAPTPTAPVTPPPLVSDSAYEAMIRQAVEKARTGRVQPAMDDFVRAAELAAKDRRVDLQENAYREAVRVAMDQPRAHTLLGEHLFERGKYSEAARSFRQAATLSADYAPAQVGLGRLAVRNNEFDAALVHFRKAMTSDPSLTDAQWELAILYDQSLEMPDHAAKAYRDFAQNFPRDARRTAALTRADVLAPAPIVSATTSAPGTLPAENSASRRIAYKVPTTRNTQAAMQAFNRAGTYQEQQDWNQAIYFYLRALENDDQLPSVLYNLGICYTMKGDSDLARDAYRRAIRLQPDLVDAKYNLALLYRERDDNASAILLLDDIVRTRADYAGAHYVLGLIYSEKSETYANAKQHYERFLRLSPNDRSAPAIRQWMAAH